MIDTRYVAAGSIVCAVQLQLRDLRSDRRRGTPGIVEAGRDLQKRRGPVGVPLLLEDRLELRAGQGDGLHDVAERLDGERLSVGHDAVSLPRRRRRVAQIGPDPARVGDRDLGVVGRRVAASWASAITSPSGCSPAALAVRVMSAVMAPTGLLASGADLVTARSTMACTVGSGVDVAGDDVVLGHCLERMTSRVRGRSAGRRSKRSRPNDALWITGRGLPAGSLDACSCTAGGCGRRRRRRLVVWPPSRWSLPGRRARCCRSSGRAPVVVLSPWCMSTIWLLTPSRCRRLDVRSMARTSSVNRRPLDPVRDHHIRQSLQSDADDPDVGASGADHGEGQQRGEAVPRERDVGAEDRELRTRGTDRRTGSLSTG